MKYDRPVWQIMHLCADAMPDVFRYDDVRGWFKTHYPEVNEATIRAHLIGLTEGGRAKHVQFAQRSPVFRRVARGEYSPIPMSDRGENPHAQSASTSTIKMTGRPVPFSTSSSARATQATPADAGGDDDAGDPDPDPDPEAAPFTFVRRRVGPVSEQPDEPHAPDVILVGSIGDQVNVPAPAKEVFRDVDFQMARLDAEVSDVEWFVLSAEHGLLAPNEWMSPDSRSLDDLDPDHRIVWASWVVARLQSIVGPLDGLIVRIDAPDAFVGPLFADLQDAGAVVSSGARVVSVARRSLLGPVRSVSADEPEPSASEPSASEPTGDAADAVHATGDEVEADEQAEVVEPDDAHDLPEVRTLASHRLAGAHLADRRHAVHAVDAPRLPEAPGLYGWIVDRAGARDLNRSLRLPVSAGLVFVGQVGGSNWHSLADPVLNLRDHLDRVQLRGRTRASTFRTILAIVLSDHLGMSSMEDRILTDWMLDHLSITTWVSDDAEGLRELAQVVVGELDPPLNVDHLPATEYRARLHQMRIALA